MDVRVFRTFLEVSHTRHFGKAAENLFLTQSAVSARIKQLEQYFSTPLFIRHRNNLQLTPAGEKLIKHAQNMVANLHSAKQDLINSPNETNNLSIAGSVNIWDSFLYQHFDQLVAQFQNYSFAAEILSNDVIMRRLLEQTLDIALVFTAFKSDDLDIKKVSTFELVLVADKKSQNNWHDRFIAIDWGTRSKREIVKTLPAINAPILSTPSSKLALQFILSHGGAAFLPRFMCEKLIKNKQLVQVPIKNDFSVELYLTFRKRNSEKEIIVKLLDAFEKNKL